MNHHLIEQAQHSIHHVHELIQRVFTDADGVGEASLAPLMQVFAPDFSMVTTAASTVDRHQVEQLFRDAVGGRLGLQIVISDVHPVWQEGESVAISYKETHRRADSENSRVSVAILRVRGQDVQWLYLHETAFIPDVRI
jgi:hypothetical protein